MVQIVAWTDGLLVLGEDVEERRADIVERRVEVDRASSRSARWR